MSDCMSEKGKNEADDAQRMIWRLRTDRKVSEGKSVQKKQVLLLQMFSVKDLEPETIHCCCTWENRVIGICV